MESLRRIHYWHFPILKKQQGKFLALWLQDCPLPPLAALALQGNFGLDFEGIFNQSVSYVDLASV